MFLLGESKSTPNCTSKLKPLMLLEPSGMTTADFGILVDGGGGFTLWIFVIRFCEFWWDDMGRLIIDCCLLSFPCPVAKDDDSLIAFVFAVVFC